jgi:SAM-dependent methyltransferase
MLFWFQSIKICNQECKPGFGKSNMESAIETLSTLYSKYANHSEHGDPYILQHARVAVMRRQIYSCSMYLPYVSGKTLDWGCKHAPDSCVLKHFKGSELELYGCDAAWASDYGKYADFHDYADLKFTALEHPFLLPYPDNFFDTVISSGVLEHVPNDYESLKEVYRILKPDGHFIVTFLPNALSYTEKITELLGKQSHTRRYHLQKTKDYLLHSGFQVLKAKYFLMLPTMLPGADSLWFLNGILEKLWPLNIFSSNLMLISQKRRYMF